jgi:hypothetical protein
MRSRIGTVDVLVTIECRRRSTVQDVTWIEQLATKKEAVGASHTIAVSASGFSQDAQRIASLYGISLRKLADIAIEDINALLRLDFVLFWHKSCAVARVGIRKFRSLDWQAPDPDAVDFTLPMNTDPLAPIFRNTETTATWSLNDLWRQIQEATNPFAGIEKAQRPVFRTACSPYPGTVTVETVDGPCLLGDVLLTVALWIEAEQVTLDDARKVEYTSEDIQPLQRVEFTSQRRPAGDLRISLQMPKTAADIAALRTGGEWPDIKK